ncbi:hypothetical protein H0A36_17370 [Endozoicomonas sp. SM1973]|uniref:Uncharacterized protein n=1 Tax=Spartinivicinus marinus TaxID=2994442 RepID=A0A853IJF6_9GAMM|nr:hypothetical protein [Spartinivicinus marinus]MCX4030143.1 hypothetical protein [Spartinivicinus marinus]NYZ67786.1 hypothetical protein [Spartinivicinus marinus]
MSEKKENSDSDSIVLLLNICCIFMISACIAIFFSADTVEKYYSMGFAAIAAAAFGFVRYHYTRNK